MLNLEERFFSLQRVKRELQRYGLLLPGDVTAGGQFEGVSHYLDHAGTGDRAPGLQPDPGWLTLADDLSELVFTSQTWIYNNAHSAERDQCGFGDHRRAEQPFPLRR